MIIGSAAKRLALLVPVVLLFGAVELGMRITSDGEDSAGDDLMIVRSQDPVLVYEFRPSHRVNPFGLEYRTNSAGFRDREFSRKDPHTFRIIVVGDSLVFGYGVPVEAALPQQLESLLGGREGPRIEVFNLGVAGYNSIQEVRLIETRALAYEPDLLVLTYVHNDNTEDGGDGRLTRYFDRSPSRLLDWLKVRTRRLSRRIGRDVTTEAYDELAVLASEQGIPVVVAIFPVLRFRDGAWSRPERHRAVRALAEQRGFAVVDLLDPFVEADFKTLMRDNVHPNARGYGLAARTLHAFLDDAKLLPPKD